MGFFTQSFLLFCPLIKAYVLVLLQGPVSLSYYTCVTKPAARHDLVKTEYLPDPAGVADFFKICFLSSGSCSLCKRQVKEEI